MFINMVFGKQLVLSITLWIFLLPKRKCICAQEKGISDKIVKVEMGIIYQGGSKVLRSPSNKKAVNNIKKWI